MACGYLTKWLESTQMYDSHRLNLLAVGRWMLLVISHLIANTTSPLTSVATDLLGSIEGNKM